MYIKSKFFDVKVSNSVNDIRLAQTLRSKIFRNSKHNLDKDDFDRICKHILIFDKKNNNKVICVFRVLILPNGNKIQTSYSAQFYDLEKLKKISEPLLELGRFCVDPEYSNPNILRVAWCILAKLINKHRVGFLFGCSSFPGVDASSYHEAFIFLRENHLAPKSLRPEIKSKNIFHYSREFSLRNVNKIAAIKSLPPLLRYYLTLGGWVSDHAVKDLDLNTLHVFTGLKIQSIPLRKKEIFNSILLD